jgi:small subunit ribosomal protein S5
MTEDLIIKPTEGAETDAPVPADVPVVPAADAVEVPAAMTASVPAATPVAAPDKGRGGRGGRGGFGGFNRGRGGFGGGRGRGPGRGPGRGRGPGGDVPESDYEEKNLEINRVTRVTKGGKRMRFRALTVIGNRKGRVGFGVAKGLDVASATSKATAQARKSLITVPITNDTIPHPVDEKFAAARVLLKPAPKGTGVKAGGAVRVVLALAGVPNVTSKILGSSNKINNVKATFKALKALKAPAKAVTAEPGSAKSGGETHPTV